MDISIRKTGSECQVTIKGTIPIGLMLEVCGLFLTEIEKDLHHSCTLPIALLSWIRIAPSGSSITLFRLWCQKSIHFQALTPSGSCKETTYDME